MIHCDVIRDLMTLYADGVSSEESKRLIEAHVAGCDGCRTVLQRMETSMEPEPVVPEKEIIRTIRRQKQIQNRRILFACMLTLCLCVMGWWLWMEFRFRTDTIRLVSTDSEKILEEVPELTLSEAELEMPSMLWQHPSVRNTLGNAEGVELPHTELTQVLLDMLPEEASLCTVFVLHGNVTLEYTNEDCHVTLEYLGGYDTEKPTVIRKTIGLTGAVTEEQAGVVYVMEYVIPLEQTRYEKYRNKHVWFAFLEDV